MGFRIDAASALERRLGPSAQGAPLGAGHHHGGIAEDVEQSRLLSCDLEALDRIERRQIERGPDRRERRDRIRFADTVAQPDRRGARQGRDVLAQITHRTVANGLDFGAVGEMSDRDDRRGHQGERDQRDIAGLSLNGNCAVAIPGEFSKRNMKQYRRHDDEEHTFDCGRIDHIGGAG